MQEFDYAAPRTLSEAVSLLNSNGRSARMLAGGTDLIVHLRTGRRQANLVVDAKYIPELNALSVSKDGLRLGAAVSCRRIYENEQVRQAYPALIDCTSMIGGVQIQGRASVGGNLCNAAPSADCIPPLIVLGAVAEIAGQGGTREVLVEEFCTGPGQTVLEPGELLVALRLPAPQPNSGAYYLRFIPRNEMDIAVAGVGASVVLDSQKRTIVSARIALAAVAPTPLLVREAREALTGKAVEDEEALQRAAELARQAARPITDMRGIAEQRRHLVGVLTVRALRGAIQRAREASYG